LSDTQPLIIQGGMGVGVSGWRLARAVGTTGHLGVVSGVALDAVLARRLQSGDPDGSAQWALSRLPIPGLAERILAQYFVPGGLSADAPFRPIPRLGLRPSTARDELIVAGNFVEVCLAKDGHSGPVGINYLEKIQLATPAAAYGAMLAGVDYVLMGAGIPTEIPRLLDRLAAGEAGKISVTVSGSASGEQHHVGLDPAALWPGPPPQLARPTFLAIVSSAILAAYLVRDPASAPDGFVLETSVAGGHSAPPRGALNLSAEGEPVYGPRDNIDEAKVAALGRPYWRAGGHAGPGALAAARAAGAAGIQVGSAFALCRESGIDPQLRQDMIERALAGALTVRNDPRTSPAGMPFKTVQLPTSVSDEKVYANRARLCDLGYLRVPYRRDDGGVGYRCPAEPVAVYVRKGGSEDDAVDRRCLCNGLMATIGLGQRHDDGVEPPLLTLGQQLEFLPELVARSGMDFTAADVVAYLLAGA
jgi:NAD(P)H-dependent flavin oxidoreductase YrpB (nitropropane dioxygenase family)